MNKRGISTPSLASLYNVAKALDASVDMFVSRVPTRHHAVVTHAGERQTYKIDGTSRFYEFLERGFPEAVEDVFVEEKTYFGLPREFRDVAGR